MTHVDSGLRRSRRESAVIVPVFNLLFSFSFVCFVCLFGGGRGWVREVWLPGSCFVFSFSRFKGMVQTMIIIIIIILIIIILIIVTCIHSIFVERQQEQVPPTYYYNKGPDSTDSQ